MIGAGHSTTQTQAPDLQLCPACRGRFVVPGRIHEAVDHTRVRLDLVCSACGWMTTVVRDDEELMCFEFDLDVAFADLLALLETVWLANEEERIASFAAALAADAILPEDF